MGCRLAMAVASPVPMPNGLDLPPPSRDLVTALRFSTGLILPPPEIKCTFALVLTVLLLTIHLLQPS